MANPCNISPDKQIQNFHEYNSVQPKPEKEEELKKTSRKYASS